MHGNDRLKDILTSYNLRNTGCRRDVLNYFLSRNSALSQGDLEVELTQYDRVTLYRTLNSFLDSGLIHKIPNSQGAATYGLSKENQSPERYSHNHIHFKCNACG